MVYPEEFKQKVLEALGNRGGLKEYLDNGSIIVGRLLDDASYVRFTPEAVVKAVDSNMVNELYAEAKRLVALRDLYGEWIELEKAQMPEEARSPHM